MIPPRPRQRPCDFRRYAIERAILCKLDSDRRRYEQQNEQIQRATKKIDEQIVNLNEKLLHLHHLNTLIELPLEEYFEQRMLRLRSSAERHLAAFEEEVLHEMEHWRNIHSILSQPWLEPGLLSSDFGALPRSIQKSPARELHPIEEENEHHRLHRSLAMINRFSILSNGDLRQRRINKTFVKIPSKHRTDRSINDENDIDLSEKSSYTDDSSIICLD